LSDTINEIDFTVQVDAGTPSGEKTLSASLYSLWGAGASPGFTNFALNFTVGDSLSSTTVIGNIVD